MRLFIDSKLHITWSVRRVSAERLLSAAKYALICKSSCKQHNLIDLFAARTKGGGSTMGKGS